MAASTSPDTFSMGPGTLSVSRKALHGGTRASLLSAMRAAVKDEAKRGVVLLKGGDTFHIYSTDGEGLFRQESYFYHLFGVRDEGFYGAVDIRTGVSTLFMPRLPEEYAVWMGDLKSPADNAAMYGVDQVRYADEVGSYLEAAAPPCVHVLAGTNTDSKLPVKPPTFDGSEGVTLEADTLFNVLTECRVFKSAEEVAVIRYANELGSRGHVEVMRMCKPGLVEYQLESAYLSYCYSNGGSRTTMYTPIAASGPNGAVLHYGHAGAPNDRQIRDGDMLLLDFGCEYYHYGSDITASWPVSGKFTEAQKARHHGVVASRRKDTEAQKAVYLPVLDALTSVKAVLKPGANWVDMHTLAYTRLLEGLRTAGLVKGEVADMLAADIGGVFMPHGLGHMLGLDTHDVGGYTPTTPARGSRPGYKSLRTARVMQAGMVVTVEPGCYFSKACIGPALLDPAKAKFLVADELAKYADFGGVRLEDNVLITATGCECLTNVPRTPDEVEAVMAGGAWPPAC
ncbi:hypothetical protein FOA52_013666 [Chlamydomonas sp. UWO 241]|nr:hypothetical protein FOA52_013666 [Chlamydomonas sp. UWO 241]